MIPSAGRVEIPSSPIRIRRDARRLVDVVRVVAWLHQHQRERDGEGRILASEEDFATALSLVSESLTRAWKTLTPSEEKVLRAIESLPEQVRRSGFRRRDLKVPSVSDRQIKDVLKSLFENGYLDCDYRAGPQDYSYTVAREAEEIALGISLRPLPDRQQSPANDSNLDGQEAFARYHSLPDNPGEGNGYREAGGTGRNDYLPIKKADLQGKRATGRTGGEMIAQERVDDRERFAL